mmetsp:Transcript_7038/g.8766  ORF Transcript_7038/g.8766 Transcript_7038/m.8766 type:complete len:412 (-) Transcript_7038:115-1350(-)|eukprot:CAMPEP_0172498884 /NCGR_PEP_ID=MMETSP1066-20121228/119055_1 /TAXON_ID=671091 /ORGANISM="Coscinodiscus wailesii, Strain CCMP2513" /LENGTH=411 /DNA_ID=CAMNT_0013272347 /DNA_START=211 /DNA_END=1446 /DNA_ORIENTATION=+
MASYTLLFVAGAVFASPPPQNAFIYAFSFNNNPHRRRRIFIPPQNNNNPRAMPVPTTTRRSKRDERRHPRPRILSQRLAASHSPHHDIDNDLRTIALSAAAMTESQPLPPVPPQHKIGDYLALIRPWTLFQAVGALVVGRLVVLATTTDPLTARQWGRECHAALSVYLSYGAGMAMNDCVDYRLDSRDVGGGENAKRNRPLASGRLRVKDGWITVGVLSALSLLSGFVGASSAFGIWCFSNLLINVAYAPLGLQNVLFVKNLIVGWLCVSPLIGASLLTAGGVVGTDASSKLCRTAAVGLPIGVSREILKDAQDVEIDRGHKMTIPLVWGVTTARWVSMGLVLGTHAVLASVGSYARTFGSSPVPWFWCGWTVSAAMSLRACFVDLDRQQRLVKKSIYVMLLGLILGLLSQ